MKKLIDLINPLNTISKNIGTKIIPVPYPYNKLQATITANEAFVVYYTRETATYNYADNEQIGQQTHDCFFKQFFAKGETAQLELPGNITWDYHRYDRSGTVTTKAIYNLYIRCTDQDSVNVQFTLSQDIQDALQDPNQIQMRFAQVSPLFDQYPYYYDYGLEPIYYTGAAWAKTAFKGKQAFVYMSTEDIIPADAGAEIILYGDLKVLNPEATLLDFLITHNSEIQALCLIGGEQTETCNIQNTPNIDRMMIVPGAEVVANATLNVMQETNGHLTLGVLHLADGRYSDTIWDGYNQGLALNWLITNY